MVQVAVQQQQQHRGMVMAPLGEKMLIEVAAAAAAAEVMVEMMTMMAPLVPLLKETMVEMMTMMAQLVPLMVMAPLGEKMLIEVAAAAAAAEVSWEFGLVHQIKSHF